MCVCVCQRERERERERGREGEGEGEREIEGERHLDVALAHLGDNARDSPCQRVVFILQRALPEAPRSKLTKQ
jgi:hypothetical protein